MRHVTAKGLAAVDLATKLLQRARLADLEAGLWEAADVQWWWRTPRRSDDVEQRFWVDDDGPVGAVLLTEFRSSWQCDALLVPGAIEPVTVWECALETAATLAADAVDVPVRDDEVAFVGLLQRDGFVAGERSSVAWMDAAARPSVAEPPEGFVLVDRSDARGTPHPMRGRNGESVEARLRGCSLYDPALDLAVETTDGEVAGQSLYWFDPVTCVGVLEPMRVEESYQRRGLARTMIAAGLDRLAQRGARRLKVGYGTAAAGALYHGSGFRTTDTSTWYSAPSKS
ncbi:MAG TPA: GNAT family N-acetyltransferase [Gaiellaceae bacterium]|nr:GNAT family N-acetyltransferase [Gaiellaceae bacterium]